MNKFFKLNSLINQTYFLVFISILVGATTSFIWVTSNNQWNIFLNNAYNSGISIYNTIKYNNDLNANITVKKLDNNNELINFSKSLENVCIEAVEKGNMTKDLAILVGPSTKFLTTNQFLEVIKLGLEKKLN